MDLFDDGWESLVNADEQRYQEGLAEGRTAALASGIREEGQRGGFLKGLAAGLELGFMERLSAPVALQEGMQTSSEKEARTQRRMHELHATATKLGDKNDVDVDYDKEIHHLRSLYKALGAPLGPFPPSVNVSASKAVAVSHEW